MEGYSVTEAASVLGVPTERVWELLARGVLSGAPEGETGMRVFLQPRPAPPAVDDRISNGHGNTRETGPEASPFRELLTEFRNLTERYGQALLALGEARGEVASLRSRVDVLEARMDLRLPMSSPMPAAPTWAAPAVAPRQPTAPVEDQVPPSEEPQAPPEQDSMAEVAEEPGAEPEREAEPSTRRKRGRGHFSGEFAEALARAEDPSPAVLPGAVEAGAAFASIRYEVSAQEAASSSEPESPEAILPRELPPAEPMAIAEPEPEPAPVPVAEAEPAIVTEPDLAFEPEAGPGPESEPVLGVEPGPEPDVEPMPAAEARPEPVLVVAPLPAAEPEPAVATEPDLAFEPEAGPGPESEPVLGVEPWPEPEVEPMPVEEAAPAEPAAVAEADLAFETEAEPVAEPAVVAEPDLAFEPEPEAPPEPEASPEAEAPPQAEPGPELDLGPDAVAEPGTPEAVPEDEPAWDRERYSADIEAPDWWTPEASVWTEPDAAPTQSAADVPSSDEAPVEEIEMPAAVTEASTPQREAPDAADDREAEAPVIEPDPDTTSREPYRDEETMLWFGRQPEAAASAEWPPEDAAGEMEVASTGRRAAADPAASSTMPGAEELHDALTALDALGSRRGSESTPAPETTGAPAAPTASERASRSRQPGELHGPASRAYRRLRRIFPG
ncbi:MAG: hypothetical protein ACT4OQ_09210 [Chloroflexota bacterium]